MGLLIGLAGNMNNNLYALGESILRFTEHRPMLLVGDGEPYINHPENDNLSEWVRPKWIRGLPKTESRYLRYLPGASRALELLRSCDLVFLSGEYLSLASHLTMPTVFFATGADLTAFPFRETYPTSNSLIRQLSLTNAALRSRHISNHVKGFNRVNVILAQPFSPYRNALALLGLHENDQRLLDPGFPIPLDTKLFAAKGADALLPQAAEIRASGDFLIFLPSRLISTPSRSRIETGSWKNPFVLFTAIRRLLEDVPSQERGAVRLVAIDRVHSPDRDRVRQQLHEAGLHNNVSWIEAESAQGFSRYEMGHLYSAVDVVADDFGLGWYGSVAVEALANGKPVLTFVDSYVMGREYGISPFLSGRTTSEIYGHLRLMWANPRARAEIGASGCSWVEEFHGMKASAANVERVIQLAALQASR